MINLNTQITIREDPERWNIEYWKHNDRWVYWISSVFRILNKEYLYPQNWTVRIDYDVDLLNQYVTVQRPVYLIDINHEQLKSLPFLIKVDANDICTQISKWYGGKISNGIITDFIHYMYRTWINK